MNPANARAQSPEARLARHKSLSAIFASMAAGAVLGTIVVVSYLDCGETRRELREPAYTETTSAPPAGPAVDDSTGGPDGRGARAGRTNVTSAQVAAPAPPAGAPPRSAPPATSARAPGTPHPHEIRPPTDTSSGLAPAATTGAAPP